MVAASPHAEAAQTEEAQCIFLFRGWSKFAEESALKEGTLGHLRLKSVEDRGVLAGMLEVVVYDDQPTTMSHLLSAQLDL